MSAVRAVVETDARVLVAVRLGVDALAVHIFDIPAVALKIVRGIESVGGESLDDKGRLRAVGGFPQRLFERCVPCACIGQVEVPAVAGLDAPVSRQIVAVAIGEVIEGADLIARQIKPRIVDVEVVQVMLRFFTVAASVVPQPVVAGIGADDLIAGLLTAGIVQDGEIARPVLVEIPVVRQRLPADGFYRVACFIRGLHLILEVPQLEHRAVGGEVAERIALLQLRHAHVGDRVLDNARIVGPDIVFHRALLELLHACGGVVVHRAVDRVGVFDDQAVDTADALDRLDGRIASQRLIGKTGIKAAVLLREEVEHIIVVFVCRVGNAAFPDGLIAADEFVRARAVPRLVSRIVEKCGEGGLVERYDLHRGEEELVAAGREHCDALFTVDRQGAERGGGGVGEAPDSIARFRRQIHRLVD